MNEKINNAAPSQAPEVIIPQPRRGLRSVPGDENKVKEPEKIKAASVPPRRLGLKIGSSITAGVVGITGIGIGLGESDKLPDPLQKTYEVIKAGIGFKNRISQDKDGTPVVDITEISKPVETTVVPTTTVAETTTTVEATTTTEAKIINAPEIAGLLFNQETKTYSREGVEVGVYVSEALTIETADGKKEVQDAIGLSPEEIEILQQQLIKEKNLYTVPLIVDARVGNISISEIHWLPPMGTEPLLGITVPLGTNFYSPLESDFNLRFIREEGLDSDDSYLSGSFDYNVKNSAGNTMIDVLQENVILGDKTIQESTSKTADGKEFTVRTVSFKMGELMGKINNVEPLRLWKDQKWVEDKGKQQIIFAIKSREGEVNDSQSYKIFGLETILKVDNKIVFILPAEIK